MRLLTLPTPGRPRYATRILAKLSATAALTACAATIFLSGTVSAFNAVTTNPAATMTAGTVSISDNDGGMAQYSLPDAEPGDDVTGCVVVTYTGSIPATVVLHGASGGTLGQYLNLKVTRGTIPGNPGPTECTGFSADSANYIGQGAGVMYSGTVAGWPDTSSTGLVDPVTGAAETWTPNETHAYLIEITLQNTTDAQGRSATQTFVWEAANT